MARRIEHHQTIVQTHFRIVDDEHSYPPPQPLQQIVYLATEAEFADALRRIAEYQAGMQKALDQG